MAGDERGYNGWTNRATWLVMVWYSPETIDDLESIKDQIDCAKQALETQYGGFFSDLMGDHAINWDELRQHIEDDILIEDL